MIQPKYILIPTLVTSLLVLGGCTQTLTTNTTNEAFNDNANVMVAVDANKNTNSGVNSGEVDTSDLSSEALAQEDWLTYTNEEYGFSVQYPSDWIFFNKIDEEGYAVYDDSIKGFVRFTHQNNRQSASSFVDISIRISGTTDDIHGLKYAENNGRYYIFNEGTWVTEESLTVMNKMIETIQFNS